MTLFFIRIEKWFPTRGPEKQLKILIITLLNLLREFDLFRPLKTNADNCPQYKSIQGLSYLLSMNPQIIIKIKSKSK